MAKMRDRLTIKQLKAQIAAQNAEVLACAKAMVKAACAHSSGIASQSFEIKIFQSDSGDQLHISVFDAYTGDGHYTEVQRQENIRRKHAFDKLLAAAHEADFEFNEVLGISKRTRDDDKRLGWPDSDTTFGARTIAIALEDDNYTQKLDAMRKALGKALGQEIQVQPSQPIVRR